MYAKCFYVYDSKICIENIFTWHRQNIALSKDKMILLMQPW